MKIELIGCYSNEDDFIFDSVKWDEWRNNPDVGLFLELKYNDKHRYYLTKIKFILGTIEYQKLMKIFESILESM